MKKIFSFAALVICVIALTGCGKNDEIKTMTCTSNKKTDQFETELEYKVKYNKDEEVLNVESNEKISSKDNDLLKQYKKTIEEQFEAYNDIEYYDFDLKLNGDTLSSKIKINYEKIDLEKLFAADSSIKLIFDGNKLKVSKLESIYESIGATCKK